MVTAVGMTMVALACCATAEAGWHQPSGGASPVNQSSAGQAVGASLAEVDGVPYVAWREFDGTNYEVRVSKLNDAGTAWTQVVGGASPINQSSTMDARSVSLTGIDGVPYVGWTESDGTNDEVHVSKLNAGGTAWTAVGGAINHDPSRDATGVNLTSIAGVPYIVWCEYDDATSTQVRVSKLNDAGTAWTEVVGGASPINEDPDQYAFGASLASVGGVPYVAWDEFDGTNSEVRVSKLNDPGTAWTQVVGGPSPINQDPAGDATYISNLISIGGTPYIAWSEDFQIRVSKLNGAGTAWTQVVGGAASPINNDQNRAAITPSLAAIDGVPYVAWSESDGNNTELRVSRVNRAGSAWVQIGGGVSPINQDPNFDASGSSLVSIAGVPYVAWGEDDNTNNELRVSRVDDRLQFSSASYSGDESSPTATVTVNRTGSVAGQVAVDYSTADGTATAGLDYVAVSGTLVFADGEASKTFAVPLVDDTDQEGDETVQLALSGGIVGAPSTATLTIADDVINTQIDPPLPPEDSSDTTPTFNFSAIPPTGATFECSVDGGAYVDPCSPPYSVPPQPDGSHTFHVRAKNAMGLDPTSATRDFFVDTVAPSTGVAISAAPGLGANVGPGEIYAGYVAIGLAQHDPDPSPGGGAIVCSVDPSLPPADFDAVATGSCPLILNTLGQHSVYAASVDAAGNKGPVTSASFTIVERPTVQITGGPDGFTWAKSPQFSFTSPTAGATFVCRIDTQNFAPCQNPWLAPPFNDGAHTFEVKAVSPAGAESDAVRRSYTIESPETHHYSCEIKPFLNVTTARDNQRLCFVSSATTGHPKGFFCDWEPSIAECVSTSDDCPAGAQCTVKSTVTWSDADPEAGWLPTVTAAMTDPTASAPGDGSRNFCRTGLHVRRCSAGTAVTGYGKQEVGFGCEEDSPPPATLGPDSARSLRCDGALTIVPSQALAAIGQGATASVNAPGAGTVAVSSAGSSKRAVARARRGKHKPAFKPVSIAAAAAGPVTFKPKLSKSASEVLKRKKKLKLTLEIAYAPPGGDPAKATQTITLTVPKKLPKAARGR